MAVKRRKSKAERLLAGEERRSAPRRDVKPGSGRGEAHRAGPRSSPAHSSPAQSSPAQSSPTRGRKAVGSRNTAFLLLAAVALQGGVIGIDRAFGDRLGSWSHIVFGVGIGLSLLLIALAGFILLRSLSDRSKSDKL